MVWSPPQVRFLHYKPMENNTSNFAWTDWLPLYIVSLDFSFGITYRLVWYNDRNTLPIAT